MEQTHSVFIATDELFTSPLIQKYASLFDVALSMQNPTLLSLIIPFRGTDTQLRRTLIHFNADLVEILNASIYKNVDARSATLSLTIEPRDVGVTNLTVSTDEAAEQPPSFSAYTPQFIKNRPIPSSS